MEKLLSRRKFVALFAAAAISLAAGLGISMPTNAYATDEPSIEANVPEITLDAGQQRNIAQYFTVSDAPGYHVDYIVTSGTNICRVVKHGDMGGTLTTTAAGTATVTAYLTIDPIEPGKPGEPCHPTNLTASIKVNVNPASGYGFQGGSVAIMMTDPKPISFTHDSMGYFNNLGTAKNEDGYYYFTIEMDNGFRDYNTPELFAARNAGNIKLLDANYNEIASVNDTNTGAITIAEVDHDTRMVKIKVDASALYTDGGAIQFTPAFRGNNNSNSLGTDIYFEFLK